MLYKFRLMPSFISYMEQNYQIRNKEQWVATIKGKIINVGHQVSYGSKGAAIKNTRDRLRQVIRFTMRDYYRYNDPELHQMVENIVKVSIGYDDSYPIVIKSLS